MRSPALTVASWVWSRHRTGFIVSAAIIAAIAIVDPLLAAVIPARTVAVASAMLLTGVFAFVMNSLLIVEVRGSLSSRYPRHMLTLPVRTRTLALWPMLIASSATALLWLATVLSIYRPAGHQLPLLIPTLALAALMAWAQALAWLPIAVPWLREVMNIMMTAVLGAVPVGLALTRNGSSNLITMVLVAYLAAAGVVGWAAVTSDRRGQSWRFWPEEGIFVRVANPLALVRRKRPFHSAFAAQVWYEWNCHGLMLNGFVGTALLLIWGVLFGAGRHGSPQWFATIISLLLIVVVCFIAASGPSLGRFVPLHAHRRKSVTIVATRPMTTGLLVTAKFRMSAMSVILNWALAVAGTTFWIVASGNADNASIMVRDFFTRYPGERGFAIIALACILLPALSWRLLTGPVVPVLTGRRWLADGAVWAFLAVVAGLSSCGAFLKNHPEHLARFYAVIPWLVAGLAALKAAVAGMAFRAVLRHGLMSRRNIVSVLCLWVSLTGCAVAEVILIGPMTMVPVSWPILSLGVASIVPLVRFPLATLALDWNRHR